MTDVDVWKMIIERDGDGDGDGDGDERQNGGKCQRLQQIIADHSKS
jgi:hypothetical protein